MCEKMSTFAYIKDNQLFTPKSRNGNTIMKIFFAVNIDGTEVCSNNNLFRYTEALNDLIERNENYRLYSDRPNVWCNTYSNGHFSVPKFEGTVLPKGTIEKLTGKNLTFNDNPFIVEF